MATPISLARLSANLDNIQAKATQSPTVSLDGPTELTLGEVAAYDVTDWNSFSYYTASATAGTVAIVGKQVVYTSPASDQYATFTVTRDGVPNVFTVKVGSPTPSQYITIPTSTPSSFGANFEGGFYAGMIWNQLTQSSISIEISTGAQTFYVPDMTKAPIVYLGQQLEVRSRTNPDSKMVGVVTSAAGTSLTMNVTSVSGSGTFSDWSSMARYRIIVAPRATGEHTGITMSKDTSAFPEDSVTISEGWRSTNDMFSGGDSMKYPAAHWVRGLNIGGYTDWYVPARDELELCWRNLKPSTSNNYITTGRLVSGTDYTRDGTYGDTSWYHGTNNNSAPTGTQYTVTSPSQTGATIFRTGGAEAFKDGMRDGGFYYTSSAVSHAVGYPNSMMWFQLTDGPYYGQQRFDSAAFHLARVRAVRRSIV